MTKLFNSKFNYNNHNQIYVQGNFIHWYNEDLDCLEDKQNNPCPIQFINVNLMDIDYQGMYLELPENWENNDTWHICEKSLNAGCYNFINSKILKKEIDNNGI